MSHCPCCAIEDVPTDDQGLIVQHGRWMNGPDGPERMRSLCTAVGQPPTTEYEDRLDDLFRSGRTTLSDDTTIDYTRPTP